MSELAAYDDLSRLDKAIVTMVEESSTEGLSLAALVSFLGGVGTFGSIEITERVMAPSLKNETSTAQAAPVNPESHYKVGQDGLIAGAIAAVVIYAGIKYRYKKLVSPDSV